MKRAAPLLLTAVLLLAAGLRFGFLLWDEGTFAHPDERSTLLEYVPAVKLPASLVEAFDPRRSPLNPFWDAARQERRDYTYGHLPLYLLAGITAGLEKLAPRFPARAGWLPPAWVGYALAGRALTALFDTVSVLLVFLIARRLYGQWAGLLAASLSALAVLHIQLAHFFAVDPIAATFVLLAVLAALRLYDCPTAGAALLAGAAVGLAASCKYSVLPAVAFPPAAAGLLAWWQASRQQRKLSPAPLVLLFLAGASAILAFALTSPFVLLDFKNFFDVVVRAQGETLTGASDLPYILQYRNTTPGLYQAEQLLRWGLGWPLGLLALAGLGWALLQGGRGRLAAPIWILLSFLLPYLLFTDLLLAKFLRYLSPATPLLIVLGTGLLADLASRGRRRLAAGVGLAVLAGTAVWAAMFINGVYRPAHPYAAATRWLYTNLPAGSCVALEHWDEQLPRRLPWVWPDLRKYTQPVLRVYDPDSEQKYLQLRQALRDCDYLVLSSDRLARALRGVPGRYLLSEAYQRALFAGALGYEEVARFVNLPRLGPWVVDDRAADESFSVYDHPPVIVFKRVRDLTDQAWDQVLRDAWLYERR